MLLNKRVVHEECYNRVFYVGILVILNCELFFKENIVLSLVGNLV